MHCIGIGMRLDGWWWGTSHIQSRSGSQRGGRYVSRWEDSGISTAKSYRPLQNPPHSAERLFWKMQWARPGNVCSSHLVSAFGEKGAAGKHLGRRCLWWVHEDPTAGFVEKRVWMWTGKTFLGVECWVPWGQLVGQIRSVLNLSTTCSISASCCSLPRKEVSVQMSGSDSSHNISAVILYVTMWNVFWGSTGSMGVQFSTVVAESSCKLDTIHLGKSIPKPCKLDWGEQEVGK